MRIEHWFYEIPVRPKSLFRNDCSIAWSEERKNSSHRA